MAEITIALVGTTGHGKSSTGNTILRKNAFEEGNMTRDTTNILTLQRADFENYKVKVFDLPGSHSQIFSEQHITRQIFSLMEAAQKIDLFIFVFNFINRFTSEEENAFLFLQKLLGHDFLKEHGMIVVTHGDLRKSEAAENNMSSEQFFRKWCSNAGDKFNSLINMVGDRILLVGNRGPFENNNERIVSSKKIHEIAVKMFNKFNPYTKEEFDKIHSTCEIL